MKKHQIFRVLSVAMCMSVSGLLEGIETPSLLPFTESKETPQKKVDTYSGIAIHDRILFKINEEQVITTLDVIRKLNLLFYSSYPHLVHSFAARSQYYATMWPVVLESVIDEFLMAADAAEKKITVDPTVINQEIEEMFGNDLSALCAHFDMTPQDVFDVMSRTLVAQKAMSMMVRSKVMLKVTPVRIREHYQKLVEEAAKTHVWKYRVLKVSCASESLALQIANKVQTRLNQTRSWDKERLTAYVLSLGGSLHCSDEMVRNDHEISDAHRAALENVSYPAFMCGQPQEHKSDYRLFVILDRSTKTVKPLDEMETQIKHQLFALDAQQVETQYREKLRSRYGYNSSMIAQLLSEEAPPLFSLL